MKLIKRFTKKHRGAALIISMIFIVIFSVLAVSMASFTGSNAQIADNQRKFNSALAAAQSGLDCAKRIVSTVTLPETVLNTVTDTQADQVWVDFCQHLRDTQLDGQIVPASTTFSDAHGSGSEIITQTINYGQTTGSFQIRFYRYNDDPRTIKLQSIGTDGEVTKSIGINMAIQKDSSVLQYAIASRGRMWITGDSTIHGDIYSSWDRADISPFNMTSDSTVNGTINTVLDLDDIENEDAFQMETLDENNNPIDVNGNVLGTNYGDRYYGLDDEIQGYHENVNYSQLDQYNIPGMDISDYDTDSYNSGLYYLPSSSSIEVEYFPHAPSDEGGYSTPRDGTPGNTWNRRLNRHVYENMTITDAFLDDNRNALFRNCTFEGVLYIDCHKNTSSYYNNVRFEDCTFNGTVVTDVPDELKWKHNCLYFTGEADFNNNTDIPATILAPHFNVNLGNTNPDQGDNNILTGAIVGGIVDVRGNAQIYGTIISMCDTTGWSSGYVTNIGATMDDGGSETTEAGDVGTIEVTPAPDEMLPSGITSPIVIKPLQDTYTEGI